MKKLIKGLKREFKKRETVPSADEPAHKLRYKFKPGFASEVKTRSLKAYRAGKGKNFELSGATVLRSVGIVEDYAEPQVVRNSLTGKTSTQQVVRLPVLAKLLNTTYQTIWRWSSKTRQIPEPILTETSQGRERPVYHVDECRVIIRAIGEHLNQFKYYREDHTGTRDRIFQEIETIRNHGEHTNGNQQSSGKAPSRSGKTDSKTGGKTRRRI